MKIAADGFELGGGARGVGRTILFHPTALVLLAGGLLGWYGFYSAFAAKFIDHVLLWTLQDASFQMLYNPLPPERRVRAVAFIAGNLKPLANGIAGLLLIAAATMHWAAWKISLAAMILAGLWLASASRVGRSYLEALLADLVRQTTTGRGDAAALATLPPVWSSACWMAARSARATTSSSVCRPAGAP
jgi:hypothetical protein